MSDVLPSAWEGLAMQVAQRGGLVPWNFKAAGRTLSTMNSREYSGALQTEKDRVI